MLLPRLLTAVVGIPLILFLIHLGSIPYLVFVLAAVGLALFEYGGVLAAGGARVQRWLLILTGLLFALTVGASLPSLDPETAGRLPACALTLVTAAAVLRELWREDHDWGRASLSAFGVLFVAWPLAHLALLRNLRPGGEALTYCLFATVWTADTAAYAVGSRWGKHKLAPVVSPKKTWEGLGGAIAGGAACLALFARFDGLGLAWPGGAGLGAAVALVAQFSDLSESMIKRASRVKDSGMILPGHGGILDRFDPFYLTAPLFYYFWAFRLH